MIKYGIPPRPYFSVYDLTIAHIGWPPSDSTYCSKACGLFKWYLVYGIEAFKWHDTINL